MDAIRQYLLKLCAASAVCAVINGLVASKGGIHKIIKLLTGMFMAYCVISPLLNVEHWDFNVFTDKLSVDSSAVQMGENMAAESTAEFIKERTAAYVLDKATDMDLKIDAEVILDDSVPPRPCAITLRGPVSPYAKEILGQYIADTLGIAKEDQHWE